MNCSVLATFGPYLDHSPRRLSGTQFLSNFTKDFGLLKGPMHDEDFGSNAPGGCKPVHSTKWATIVQDRKDRRVRLGRPRLFRRRGPYSSSKKPLHQGGLLAFAGGGANVDQRAGKHRRVEQFSQAIVDSVFRGGWGATEEDHSAFERADRHRTWNDRPCQWLCRKGIKQPGCSWCPGRPSSFSREEVGGADAEEELRYPRRSPSPSARKWRPAMASHLTGCSLPRFPCRHL